MTDWQDNRVIAKKSHSVKTADLAAIFILTAGTLWGMIGLFSSTMSGGGFSSMEITFIRNAVAAVGLWGYLLIFRRNLIRIELKDIWMFLGTGILSIVFFNIMYFTTIQLSTLSIAAILLYTAPCFVMVMSVLLFHEKMTKAKVAALICAFCGCVFTTGIVEGLVSGQGPGNITGLGIMTGICSGIGYALYSIFGNIALKKYQTETVTAYTFLIAAVSLMPFCLNGELIVRLQNSSMAANALGIGLVSTLAPFCFYTAGLKYTEPGKASVMAFVEPMVATLIGIFILHQKITITGIAGILLIFISIVILNSKKHNC